MDKPPRNPVWSRDEPTLALDLYIRTHGNPTAKDDAALEALSAILNKMHRLNGESGSDRLRNRDGVYLKVMNFRSSYPAYLSRGMIGQPMPELTRTESRAGRLRGAVVELRGDTDQRQNRRKSVGLSLSVGSSVLAVCTSSDNAGDESLV